MKRDDYFQCVPNFSEGVRKETVGAIADAIRGVPGAELRNYSADADHNRCVMTILGGQDAVENASLAAAEVAVRLIDLRMHRGAHPRVGAIDVLPVVPMYDTPRQSAMLLADRIAGRIANELEVPIYLYEWNASPGRKTLLPELRKGGFEALGDAGRDMPDYGTARFHPSAGVTIVGARGPLVAFNINFPLTGEEGRHIALVVARRIRREREFNPILKGVRALGLMLPSQHLAQISLNLTSPNETTLPAIFKYVANALSQLGVRDLHSEVIGVIPRGTLGGESPETIRWQNFHENQLL